MSEPISLAQACVPPRTRLPLLARHRGGCGRVGVRMTRDPVSVTVLHTCVIDGTPTDHEAPVEVREIRRVTLGLRYHGVRCDGTRIEWVAG